MDSILGKRGNAGRFGSIRTNSARDETANPFIQDLLRKSEAKKEERKRERLESYYRRNFGDYFDFEMGNPGRLSPDTRQQIAEWQERNSQQRRWMKPSTQYPIED